MRLAQYIIDNPDYTFNLRVDWQDPFLKDAFEHTTRGCKNIVYHARYDDLNDFWNQMSFVISTSDIESFSFNIAEAMSAGCHPLVYPWKGAEAIWPADSIINGKLDFTPSRTMEEEREYIKINFPLEATVKAMKKELFHG